MRVMIPALFAAAALSAGCAYNAPTPTSPSNAPSSPSPSPASIRATASSRTDFTTAVVATVLTADGRFVPGIPIGFATASGTVSTSATTTDANGSATTIVSTPTNTTVTVTIGVLSTTVQVTGAAAPNTGTPTPPIPAPTPPTVTPIAIVNAPSTATTGTAVTFNVSAPANGQTWNWNFGDGGTASTTAFTTAHTYSTAGTYPISVSAPGITSGNASITVSNAASTGPGSSTAGLVASMSCTVPTTHGAISCNVSAFYNGTALQSSAITSVAWDWGDGFTNTTTGATAPISSRTYANAGTYTIFANVTANTSDGSKTFLTSKSITTP